MNKSAFNTVAFFKSALFYLVLFVLAFIGLLWFARPSTSDVEKRELTKFPTPTFSGLIDGTFTKGVDTWYSDTYPLRELFMSGNNKIESLFGDRSTQFVGKGEQADDIPDETTSNVTSKDTNVKEDTSSVVSEEEESYVDGTINAPVEKSGSVYIAEKSGYGMYYFSKSVTERYAKMINHTQEVLGDKANVYCLIAPLNSGVMLDKSVHESLGASDQKEAIDYMYSLMNKSVKTVDAFTTIKKHNAEYIYFHTDHHWTALGAYYAYEAFTKVKGITANSIDSFEKMEFDGFLGSYYTDSKSQVLYNNPDTVTAYIPQATNDMTMTQKNGSTFDWNIIYDVTDWTAGTKYNCFAGGDNPYSEIHNPNISDGSSCVVIKDSYANAFIPFLVDHYEYVYWIDFRYYTGTLTDLVNEKGINDVIYLTDIYNTSTTSMVANMEKLVP